jgi:tripartite-type tricarboxylate transporter receptor subunit TctC
MGATVKASVAFFVLTGSIVTAGLSAAQNYPSRPIRLIVSAASGGPSDIAARNLANELGAQLGQQVVVDNRPGVGGIIGYEMLTHAAPDGYTVGYIGSPFAANPSMYANIPYDSAKDFQPIILFGSNANLLAVTPSLPIRSVKELIEQARAKPGTLSFAGNGFGSPQYLSMELLKFSTGINIVHIPYKGSSQAITDVIGGQINMVCDVISSILPHVRGGRVRALAVTSLKRSLVVPEVPTINEAGIPGYEITNWGGYSFPAGTPRALVLRLNSELNKAMLSPPLLKAIADRGGTPIGGTPEQFADHIRKEIEKWGKVIKAAGITAQ